MKSEQCELVDMPAEDPKTAGYLGRPALTLISHHLCPYVQRAAIVLSEKGIAFDRVDIDLVHKPDWFPRVSPLGKTPVLLIEGQPIFESAVICEYLDETASPRLHPQDPLERARHRGWMEFGSVVLNAIGAFYNAPDEETLLAKVVDIRSRFEQMEAELTTGPYFAGERFTMVDAVFGPIFRYFDVFEQYEDFGFFAQTPRVRAWRIALASRESVQGAASPDYPASLLAFLLARKSVLSRRIEPRIAAGRCTTGPLCIASTDRCAATRFALWLTARGRKPLSVVFTPSSLRANVNARRASPRTPRP